MAQPYYLIIDRHTGAVVGKAHTLAGALKSIDRRDNAYGAYRYMHKRVSIVELPNYDKETRPAEADQRSV